ncbi:MAG: hypothetical protein SCH39_12240, partial [Methanosarcinales archaeon]|nr:hypothetical protein [Methanosarcinales archaeon]
MIKEKNEMRTKSIQKIQTCSRSILISLILCIFLATSASATPATPNDNWKIVFDDGIDIPYNYSTTFTPKVWLYDQGGNPVSTASLTYAYKNVNDNSVFVTAQPATNNGDGSYSGAAIDMQSAAHIGDYINVLFTVGTMQEQHVFYAGQSNAARGALWKIEVLNTSMGPSWNGGTHKIYMKLYSDAGLPMRNNFNTPTINGAGANNAPMTYEEDGVYSYTITSAANADYYIEIYNRWSGAPTGGKNRYTEVYAGFNLEANSSQGDEASPEILEIKRSPYFPVDDDYAIITAHVVDNFVISSANLHYKVNNQTETILTMNPLSGLEWTATIPPYLLEDDVTYWIQVSDGTTTVFSDSYKYNVQDHRGEPNMSHSFMNHPVYWFGNSSQPSFVDQGGDTNYNGAWSASEPDNVVYLGDAISYPYFKDMTRIKVQSLIMDETGKPIQHLTNVKAWLSANNTQSPGTHNLEKTMIEVPSEGPGVYRVEWEGSPNLSGSSYVWSDEAKAIWGKYKSGEVYSVYIDINGDGTPEENVTWLAYNFGDTYWGASIGRSWDGHSGTETGQNCNKICHSMAGSSRTHSKDPLTCPDCHGVYLEANNGIWPIENAANASITDSILYGNSTAHPRGGEDISHTCGDDTCHNVVLGDVPGASTGSIVEIPGYETGTRVDGTFSASYPNTIQCSEHHNYNSQKIPVEEGHNRMVACKYCHGGSHSNNRLTDYDINNGDLNTIDRGTPGYVGSGGETTGTSAADCYKDCHKTQVGHSLTGIPAGAAENVVVPCDECHEKFNTAPAHQESLFPYEDRDSCRDCHQQSGTGNIPTYNASFTMDPPRVPSILHAQDTGTRWNNTGERAYWVENGQSCRFCHGRSYNFEYGLGRIKEFMGTNVINGTINSTSYWCGSCHVETSDATRYNYSNMAYIYNYSFGVVPPEITNSTWRSDRSGYEDHEANVSIGVDPLNSSTYSDDRCFSCHGGSLSQDVGMDAWQHNVSTAISESGGDTTAPTIFSVNLNTTTPNTGEDVLVTVN